MPESEKLSLEEMLVYGEKVLAEQPKSFFFRDTNLIASCANGIYLGINLVRYGKEVGTRARIYCYPLESQFAMNHCQLGSYCYDNNLINDLFNKITKSSSTNIYDRKTAFQNEKFAVNERLEHHLGRIREYIKVN